MRNTILTALFVLLLSGCGLTRHEGKIEIFNATGKSTGLYVATLDRQMMMEVVDPNGIVVKVDSRGQSGFGEFMKSLLEVITFGLVMNR